jgi:AGCS family alanine or glycine:cation symporter
MEKISQWIADASDAICGYPEFLLLIGGGLILFVLSRGISIRHLPQGLRALRDKQASDSGKQTGQISSVQALLSAIAATVGMGNIAGVAIALSVGGPGVIFWMWVSALLGMTTKFFEGALSVMYRGQDDEGNPQGGPMYFITQGLGKQWHWLAVAFSIFGLVGTLCFMQANQLVESVTTVFTTPMGIENTAWLRFGLGVVMALIVGAVIMGGIGRIAKWASRLVPFMVVTYLVFVLIITVMNIGQVPHIFKQIFEQAFTFQAGAGAFFFVALTGARRAAMVNEAGVGTASMMHGASKNTDPIREGHIAMLGPAIDSGIVCTLTAIPILIAGNYVGLEDPKGLYVALGAWGQLLPGIGQYLLMAIVFCFAFSTMFSYSYYGQKCTNFLFGTKGVKWYNYYYLVMIVVAAVMSLKTMVSIMDIAFALMAFCTMPTIIALAPRVMKLMKR